MLKRAVQIKKKAEQLEEQRKELNKQHEAIMFEVADLMDDDDVKSVRFDYEGETLGCHVRQFESTRIVDEIKLTDWLTDNSIPVDSVRQWAGGKVKSLYKERFKENQPLPEGVEMAVVRKAVVVKG